MPKPPRDQVEAVLAQYVQEQLLQGETMHVPGLGAFSVEHRSSEVVQHPDGRSVMKPPADEVVFTPEAS